VNGATIVGSLLTALWLLDAVRLRNRARALATLSSSDELLTDADHFVVRKGVVISDDVKRAAAFHARKIGLSALDLVAHDLPSWRALLFLQAVDVSAFRSNRLAAGRSAGDAIWVSTDLWNALTTEERAPATLLEMTRVARKLKLHACTSMDFAIAPTMHAGAAPSSERADLVEYAFGEFSFGLLLMQLALIAACCVFSPRAGAAALLAMHLQLAIGAVGSSLAPRGLLVHTLFRTLVDLGLALRAISVLLFRENARAEERRATYSKVLKNGTEGFFEPRRDTCPICENAVISRALRTVDRYGFKPGNFTLEKCDSCGHIFQNPRLSIDGLNFYYRDFYDGLGEGLLDTLFSFDSHSYEMRARMVCGVASPKRWLDVGAGHGHFCCIARGIAPAAVLDGLDLSESIDEARARGWIDRAYRGLFPDLASDIAKEEPSYDVVSMSHYLEHTRDPRAEIEAARTVLARDGLLMIEVPDPQSRMGKLLGSFWVPWFQPQHQHLLSVHNLSEILQRNAFEVVTIDRGAAHQKNDLTFFVFTFLNHIAKPVDLPWRKRSTPLGRLWRQVVWCPGLVIVGFWWAVDQLIAPLLQREGWSNTYRVLARRTS
jgi:SAM-dependent methyltransferase